jgi:hypothetical protein
VSQATVIMISSLLKDSSDGLDAVSVQMITEITYKTLNLISIYKVLFLSVMEMDVAVVCCKNNILLYEFILFK